MSGASTERLRERNPEAMDGTCPGPICRDDASLHPPKPRHDTKRQVHVQGNLSITGRSTTSLHYDARIPRATPSFSARTHLHTARQTLFAPFKPNTPIPHSSPIHLGNTTTTPSITTTNPNNPNPAKRSTSRDPLPSPSLKPRLVDRISEPQHSTRPSRIPLLMKHRMYSKSKCISTIKRTPRSRPTGTAWMSSTVQYSTVQCSAVQCIALHCISRG